MAAQAVQIRPKATLVEVNGKRVSTQGWRMELFEAHLREHIGAVVSTWCTVECIARHMFGRNSEANREAARRRMSHAFRFLLTQGLFLVIEYGDARSHGKILAVKLFDTTKHNAMEQEVATVQLSRMERRKELNTEQLKQAWAAIGYAPTP